jgi:ribosome recycling factor
MLAYRTKSALYNILSEFYKSTPKEDCVILKEIFTSDADMVPDFENNMLTIRLHSLSTPRTNEAVKKLCALLNQTETCFPFTNLRLLYK